MRIKRRGKKQGLSHRITLTFGQETYDELLMQSNKLGYSLAEIARRVIDRGVVGEVVSLTQAETKEELYEKLCRLHERRAKGLLEDIAIRDEDIAIRDQLIATQHQQLCEYETTLYGPYEGDQKWRDEQAKIKRETAG